MHECSTSWRSIVFTTQRCLIGVVTGGGSILSGFVANIVWLLLNQSLRCPKWVLNSWTWWLKAAIVNSLQPVVPKRVVRTEGIKFCFTVGDWKKHAH